MANRSTRLFLNSGPNSNRNRKEIFRKHSHVDLAKRLFNQNPPEKKIPKIINIESITRYEIERIHDYALLYFDIQERTIPDKEKEIKNLSEKDIGDMSYVDQVSHLDLIKKKKKEIRLILKDKNKDRYLAQILPLLERYKLLFENEEAKTFGIQNEISLELMKEMSNMISIVRYFTQIEFSFNIKVKPSCSFCNYDFSDLMPDIEGIICCPSCSMENDVSHCSDRFIEIEKIIPTVYCDYNVENNFIKFLDKFQGKIQCNLSKEVYKKLLDDYFTKNRKDIGDVVKKRNYDYKGFKEGTSLEMMLVSLKNVGLSDFYEDVYFICKKYWGWILPDLEENRAKIIYIYETTQAAYENIKNKKRSSSISIPFHTLKILELLDYKYSVSDFKIPKDEKSKRELEEYWKITCANSKSPLIYYKATKWDS